LYFRARAAFHVGICVNILLIEFGGFRERHFRIRPVDLFPLPLAVPSGVRRA
jgi:hypothetical protein